MRFDVTITRTLMAAALLVGGACASDRVTAPGSQLTADAVVRYKSFEGGFYAIETTEGRHLDPTNLPTAYREDGLAVRVSGSVRTDLTNTHMYGEIFDISDITRR